MTYYIDIDETICFYEGERHYPNALPYTERIKRINDLYDAGHTIVYWTARGTVTGIDWTETTREQLIKWGAKFPSHDQEFHLISSPLLKNVSQFIALSQMYISK